MTKQNKNTWLFIGFLLLAGFTNMIGRFLPIAWDALMNCIQYVLYTGLLIFWLEVMRIKLLPSRARTYMYSDKASISSLSTISQVLPGI